MMIAIIVGVRMIGESQAWLNPRRRVFCPRFRAAGSSARAGDGAFSIGVPVDFIFINSGRAELCSSVRQTSGAGPYRVKGRRRRFFRFSAAKANFLLLDTRVF